MGDLIELPGAGSTVGRRLTQLRRAAGLTDERYRNMLAKELRWPSMSAAVLGALEAGHPVARQAR